MVGIVNGLSRPPVYLCMVEGCKNEIDPGSTQSLCRPCYSVITTGNTDKYYADHQGSTWLLQIIRWNYNLRQEVKELEYNQDHAYFREDDKYMSLNDLRNFYVDHNNLYGKALGSSVIDKRLLKDAQDALDKKNMENLHLRDVIRDLEKDHVYKSQIIDNLRKEIDRGNLDHYNNVILKKGHEQKDQHIDSLRKEIEALNYNIDHAHQIDFDKYMSLDDLCIFYAENNGATKQIEYLNDKIADLRNEIHAMEGKLSKKEDFATKTKEHFEKRAEAAGEKVRFDAYTDGFYKGFDLGYEKAKDQFYE